MRLETGFQSGSRVVHLTHTALTTEALCGELDIDFLGEPALATICEDCDRTCRALGLQHDHWVIAPAVLTDRAAPELRSARAA